MRLHWNITRILRSALQPTALRHERLLGPSSSAIHGAIIHGSLQLAVAILLSVAYTPVKRGQRTASASRTCTPTRTCRHTDENMPPHRREHTA